MAKFFLFPALIKSVQNCPMASGPLIGCTPGGIKMASLVYSAGNAFPFMLLYAADHSLFAASIAALILSWPHAVGENRLIYFHGLASRLKLDFPG